MEEGAWEGQFGAVAPASYNSAQGAPDSSFASDFLAFSLLMKQRLAAAAQGQEFRFFQSMVRDRCLVALPVERTMTLCNGAGEAVKEVEADAEAGVQVAFTVYAAVMNVVEPPCSQEPDRSRGIRVIQKFSMCILSCR
jgi:hypothetical protein